MALVLGACGGPDADPAEDRVARCLDFTAPAWTPCALSELPLMGDGSALPPAARVRAGQPWMKDAFLDLAATLPDPVRAGFRSLTGVVISVGVGSAFVSLRTGALYLDPALLDDRPGGAEAAGGAEAPGDAAGADDAGAALLFRTRGRYQDPSVRARAVLFHELAHAVDQFPAGEVAAAAAADPGLTPEAFARGRTSLSATLPEVHPLQAGPLFDLTRVTVDGGAPTEEQRRYEPEQAAADFAADGANDFYAYASPQEDLALLIEELRVARWLGVRREVIVERRTDGAVVWGQVGRIAAPAVRARLRYVVRGLLPDPEEAEAAIDALPPADLIAPDSGRP